MYSIVTVCNSLISKEESSCLKVKTPKVLCSVVPGNERKRNIEKGRDYMDLYNKESNQKGQRQRTLEKLTVEQWLPVKDSKEEREVRGRKKKGKREKGEGKEREDFRNQRGIIRANPLDIK